MNFQNFPLYIFRCKPIAKTKEDKEGVADLERKIIKRKAQLHELEQALPRQSGFYLRIILGDVNVSILNRQDKVRYKDEYEKFKLILNVIGLSMAFINLLVNYRWVFEGSYFIYCFFFVCIFFFTLENFLCDFFYISKYGETIGKE